MFLDDLREIEKSVLYTFVFIFMYTFFFFLYRKWNFLQCLHRLHCVHFCFFLCSVGRRSWAGAYDPARPYKPYGIERKDLTKRSVIVGFRDDVYIFSDELKANKSDLRVIKVRDGSLLRSLETFVVLRVFRLT